MKKILVIGLICLMSLYAFASAVHNGTYGFQNMKGLAGVRAIGMGGAFTAVANDSSAIYWNPAGLSKIKRTEINGQFLVTSAKDDVNIESISQSDTAFTWGSFVTRIGDTGFGIAMNNLLNVNYNFTYNYPGTVYSWWGTGQGSSSFTKWREDYEQTLSAYTIALSQKLWFLNIGLAGNIWSGSDKTNWNIDYNTTAVLDAEREYKLSGFSLDLGLLSQFGPFSLGAMWRGLTTTLEQELTYTEDWTTGGTDRTATWPKEKWQGENNKITFGAAFEPGIITLAADIDYDTDNSEFGNYRVGAEIDFSLIKARAGMNTRKIYYYDYSASELTDSTINDYTLGAGISILGYIDIDAALLMEGYKSVDDVTQAIEDATNITYMASGTVRL
ncbi:MAG: UPF0164 family protein [Candidatus Margulisiibacteriota bacterium]